MSVSVTRKETFTGVIAALVKGTPFPCGNSLWFGTAPDVTTGTAVGAQWQIVGIVGNVEVILGTFSQVTPADLVAQSLNDRAFSGGKWGAGGASAIPFSFDFMRIDALVLTSGTIDIFVRGN